ncbi:MAG TPA: sensor histidine kinase [Pseudonocardiaceae bacterium]|jgi:two-component system sensor histidine kinase DesK|nr:sensor histidine kinase [Pseudonocardiaceae bacterium]
MSTDLTGEPGPAQTPDRPWGRTYAWLNLVYLALLVFQPAFDPQAGRADWALVIGTVVITIALFAGTFARPGRARWWFTVPVTVLGLVVSPFNTGATVLYVYAAASAGLSESRRTAFRWFAGLTVLTLLAGVISSVPLPWRIWGVLPSLLFIWIVGLIQLQWTSGEHETAELRLRNARIEHLATIAERERIARDLHDLLGHSLTAVIMRAQLIRQFAAADPDRVATEATELEDAARGALAQVRAVVSGWRQVGLDEELESAQRTLASAGVELVTSRDPGVRLVGPTEHVLALALREAVTNVARHARARTCRVGLEQHVGELRLVISDDGVGGSAREGNGLSGMRERVTAIGGQVARFGSAGTTVTISVPLKVAT